VEVALATAAKPQAITFSRLRCVAHTEKAPRAPVCIRIPVVEIPPRPEWGACGRPFAGSPVILMNFTPLRRAGEYLLGALICWQLLFVLSFNYLQVLVGPIEVRELSQSEEKPGAGDQVALAVQEIDYRWAELTGQYQCWWLFAIPLRESVFPLVELRWDDPNQCSGPAAGIPGACRPGQLFSSAGRSRSSLPLRCQRLPRL
jgi:hypothetical protein